MMLTNTHKQQHQDGRRPTLNSNRFVTRLLKTFNLRYAMDYVIEGWPEHIHDVKLAAREFYGIRNELSIYDRLLLRGDRIVIPFSLREEMIEKIHDGHLGINKCRERANQSMSGMGKEIENRVTMCQHCLTKKPSQPSEPLIPTELPSQPFIQVASDLFEFRKVNYLSTVDGWRFHSYQTLHPQKS